MCEKVNIPEQYINKNCSDYFDEININTWKEVKQLFKLFSTEWIFRGQIDSQWGLVPSIERVTRFAGSDDLERIIIDGLKEKVLNISQGKECPKTKLGWMAFAQHHGGLTRLLDFTTDFYIACFFSFGFNEETDVLPEKCSVWVLNKEWCKKNTLERLTKISRFQTLKVDDMDKSQFFDDAFVFNPNFVPCVCPFMSDWKNERMEKQKSIFLCKCNPMFSFDSNLLGENGSILESKIYVKKTIMPMSIREEALSDLVDMNITTQTILSGEEYFQEMRNVVKMLEEHARATFENLRKNRE